MACVSEHQLTIVGGLGFLFIFLTLWMLQHQPVGAKLPPGFKQAGLAFQLAGTPDGIGEILGPKGSRYRESLRASIKKDFAYLVSYTLLLAALGLTLSRVAVPGAKAIGLAATVAVVLAGIFDFVENSRMLKVLALDLDEITNAMALGIRHASLMKWGLLLLSMGLAAVVLLWPRNRFSIVGVFFLLAALGGFTGLLKHFLLGPAMILFFLGVVVLAILFTIWPGQFLNDFC